ncbi:hypothetical protein LOD99_1412 [Oopsacas minuta]|uniref:Hemicentin-1-like von Willebrand factor A domain-containing protein n=1 Tax=Oopsacas minuta TaxID=111878 RepID=A0AAV7K5M1_9METZ|nr:hypothetical protein LOD99_1412 [Oopsacas minuta]
MLCTKPIYPKFILDEETFKKLEFTNMFTSENIFNIYQYVTEFLSVLNTDIAELTREEFAEMVQPIKEQFEKDSIGCPNQCPSCGKLCERELHPNNGKCMIKTGHQICSMGGKVWNYDENNSAVLFMCDDFRDNTTIVLQGRTRIWKQFKHFSAFEWDWHLPKDHKNLALQYTNREKMKNIWNKFGRGILEYYSVRGTAITFVPYTSSYDVYQILQVKYYICFVIDGTMSMLTELKRVRNSVGQFIKMYKEHGSVPHFKVIIYRDHCDKVLLEKFPNDNKFTSDFASIQEFLLSVEAYGGLDFPEAALDGLATAATECEWKTTIGVKNIIIHIFDAPPHGDFPNPTVHDLRSNKAHCCCCNHGTICPFDWQTHVWDNIEINQIEYHGINTGKRNPSFEATMKEKLGDLCGEFQTVGKEVVNDAILKFFIDHQN